jgi:hypothetical protein
MSNATTTEQTNKEMHKGDVVEEKDQSRNSIRIFWFLFPDKRD